MFPFVARFWLLPRVLPLQSQSTVHDFTRPSDRRKKPNSALGEIIAAAAFVLAGTVVADASPVLFSSFGPSDSFGSGALAITGPLAPSSEPARDLGAGFAASSGGRLYSIELPFSYFQGAEDAGDIVFWSDDGGLPGVILESWHLTDLPDFLDVLSGQLVTITSVLRPKIKKGQTYWVTASADVDTILHWWVTLADGPGVAYRYGDGPWGFASEGDSLAFRVKKAPGRGGVVPEPGLLFLMGLGITAVYLRRHVT
jgi:hypothetical protein